jgi:hypothetical protein
LTAGQSLFAVAILVSLSMSRWEALALAALFFTQFVFTDQTIRVAYGAGYCALAMVILVMDVPHFGSFGRAVKDGLRGSARGHHAGEPLSTGPP